VLRPRGRCMAFRLCQFCPIFLINWALVWVLGVLCPVTYPFLVCRQFSYTGYFFLFLIKSRALASLQKKNAKFLPHVASLTIHRWRQFWLGFSAVYYLLPVVVNCILLLENQFVLIYFRRSIFYKIRSKTEPKVSFQLVLSVIINCTLS
jgi:hypothetical protein